jgi:hypothetical protein
MVTDFGVVIPNNTYDRLPIRKERKPVDPFIVNYKLKYVEKKHWNAYVLLFV